MAEETTKCPYCAEEIRQEAVKCKHCGSGLEGTDNASQTNNVSARKQSKHGHTSASVLSWFQKADQGTKATIMIIVGVIVVVSGAILVGVNANQSSSNGSEENETTACVMAQSFVEEVLKSPSSADFQWCTDAQKQKVKENVYRIRSHVDSQNSFGAQIRSEYVAQVKYVGDDNWRLQYLKFDGEVVIDRSELSSNVDEAISKVEDRNISEPKFRKGIIDGCAKDNDITREFCVCFYDDMRKEYGSFQKTKEAMLQYANSENLTDTMYQVVKNCEQKTGNEI